MTALSEDAQVYIAPNIRELALDTLNARAEQRRNRRMIHAIELNQTRRLKTEGLRGKTAEKFAKSVTKAEKLMNQMTDLMDKFEDEIKTATGLHNAMVLFDEELK